jgi:hypothetical protein
MENKYYIMDLLNIDTKQIFDYIEVKSYNTEKPLWNSFSNGKGIKDIGIYVK